MDINIKLKELRKLKGLSLNKLARELDISVSHLTHIERGQAKSIPFDTLRKICDALDCEPGDLLVREKIESA